MIGERSRVRTGEERRRAGEVKARRGREKARRSSHGRIAGRSLWPTVKRFMVCPTALGCLSTSRLRPWPGRRLEAGRLTARTKCTECSPGGRSVHFVHFVPGGVSVRDPRCSLSTSQLTLSSSELSGTHSVRPRPVSWGASVTPQATAEAYRSAKSASVEIRGPRRRLYATITRGRSGRGSLPCSRRRRSRGPISLRSRNFHRLPPGRGAGSWNRRPGQPGGGPLDLAGLAVAAFKQLRVRRERLPLCARCRAGSRRSHW